MDFYQILSIPGQNQHLGADNYILSKLDSSFGLGHFWLFQTEYGEKKMNPFAVIGSATVLIPNFLSCQASFLLLCRLTVLSIVILIMG